MLSLYHFGGAICAQKVRIALAEKGLDWESRQCSGATLRDPEYLKLNPNGVVPTLVHDGHVLGESRIISEYIDDAFDGPPLMPSDPRRRHHARLWSKRIDDNLHLSVFILSFAIMMRDRFLTMPDDVRASAMPGLRDPIKRDISEDLLRDGLPSPWVAMAIDRFRTLLTDMEAQLDVSPYLAGPEYSLADADYTAYLNRLIELGLDHLWANLPRVRQWWQSVTERTSYQTAIVDWNSPEEAERYRIAKDRSAPALRTMIAIP